MQVVLDVVPQRDLGQRRFDELVQPAPLEPRGGVDPQAEHDVFVDGDGQRVRPLKHHADRLAQLAEADIRIVDVLAEDTNLALGPHVAVSLVQPVEAAQERRLAAAGRADEPRDQSPPDLDIDALERLEVAVPEAQVHGLDAELAVGDDRAHPKCPRT